MPRLRPLLVLLLLVPLAACEPRGTISDEGFRADTAETAAETAAAPKTPADSALVGDASDVYAMASQGGEVVAGLTDRVVYFRLSDELLHEIDREMSREAKSQTGLGGRLADAVTGGVSSMLRHRVEYTVDEIRSVEYADGGLRLVFEDGETGGPSVETDDGTPIFARADAERFIAAFEDVKAGAR